MTYARIWVSSCNGVGVCSPKRMISLDKQDGPPNVYRPPNIWQVTHSLPRMWTRSTWRADLAKHRR